MKKGIRQIRFCKSGCGRVVKEIWHKGIFKGYRKTCGICNPHTHTKDSKNKISQAMKGFNHPRAKPLFSRRKTNKGKKSYKIYYWEIKVSPSGKWKLEHRYIMEQKINRKLKKSEHVHHINGDTLDNSIDNLIILNASKHMRITGINNRDNKTGFWNISKSHKCPICGLLHMPPQK